MALPTLQPFWLKNYKNPSEGFMVRRNQNEADFRENWGKTAHYFHKSEVQTAKQTGWTSQRSFQQSMDALDHLYKKQTKSEKLAERRNRLAKMLCDETKDLEEEMRELRLSESGKLLHMKERSILDDFALSEVTAWKDSIQDLQMFRHKIFFKTSKAKRRKITRVDELKSDREERRKKVAEERLYEHWKQNEPELRKVESDTHRKHVINAWGDQVVEKDIIHKTAREEERRLDHRMELQRLKRLEEERRKAEDRKRQEIEQAQQLKRQMEELKMREEEALMLKTEQDILDEQQRIVDEAEEKRKRLEEQRKKQEFGRVLIRQHKAQLRKKSRQVQEALELDLKILEELALQDDKEKAKQTARREKARADAEYMKQIVAEQLRLEKAREAEVDLLYQEEAARQWQKRETEWERERLARERLMNEVLGERQHQIDRKKDEIRKRQEESIQRREELIRDMEAFERMTHREREDEEKRKREREEEIMSQITSRRQRQDELTRREAEELARERREEQAYKKLLQREAQTISEREPTERTYHRRRFAFQ